MDEWVDGLLVPSGRVCAVVLPVIRGRGVLEDEDRLEERVSLLGEELEDLDRDGGSGSDEGEVEELGSRRNGGGRWEDSGRGDEEGSGSGEDERSHHDRSDDEDMDDGD